MAKYNLFDAASLVTIPTGVKDGKLYSIKPEDGSGDFTFSRDGAGASPATRVNSQGLIEKGRENVLLQSNQFDTTWGGSNINLTSGQSGYDGSNNAWLFEKSAWTYITQITSISSVNTFSVYAKAGTLSHLLLYVRNANDGKYFDLVNGTIGSDFVGSPIDAKIESVGNGWYRCSVTTNDATNNVRIYSASADNDTSSTSGSIYIQDAQLEQGLVATEYIETTTAPVSAGLLGDTPRLDYSNGATCPSLLLEPSRTNLVPQSEYFDSSSWTNDAGSTLTTNAAISPDGSQNATRFESPLSSKGLFTYGAVNNETISIYIKAGNTDNIGKSVNLFTSTISQSFVLTDEWQRISVSGSVSNLFALYPSSGDGVNAFIWGAQAEAGSYPTSYIPTYGSAATRSYDSCLATSITDSIGQEQGTLFFDYVYLGLEAVNQNWFAIQNTTATDRILLYSTGNSGSLRFLLSANGSTLIDNSSLISETAGTRYKVAVSYISGAVNIFINGTKIINYTTAFSFANDISILTFKQANQQPASKINQTAIFPTALTDSECIALTTL